MEKIFKNLIPIIFVSFIGLTGCNQSTNPPVQEITQVNYIVPIWKGSLEIAPKNPEIGWAYYNKKDGKSYIYDGNSWQILAQDGKDGIDGENGINGNDGADGIDGSNGTNGSNGNTYNGFLIIWKGSLSEEPTNPEGGWAYYNTTDKKSYIYDGTIWQILAQDGIDGNDGTDGIDGSNGQNGSSSNGDNTSNYVYLGETTENIDGISYTVKSFAYVYAPEGYFYNYYKFYYLNEKLRRTYTFYHSNSCSLDYRYDEFIEHKCGNNSYVNYISEYYESGVISKYIQLSINNGLEYKYIYIFDINGNNTSTDYYMNDILYSSHTYYENGNTKENTQYNSDGSVNDRYTYTYWSNGNKKTENRYNTGNILYYSYEYFENGREKATTYYNANGSVSSKYEYTYWDNGNKKTEIRYTKNELLDDSYTYYENGNRKTYDDYDSGVLNRSYTYFDDGSTNKYIKYNIDSSISEISEYYVPNIKKYSLSYNADGTIDKFDYHYPSGYTQYYYTDSGYLYTYDDKVTTSTSTSSSYYKTKTAYTAIQAKEFWESLEK